MGTFLSSPTGDGFDDEITTPREVPDDPVPVFLDEDATRPVDPGAMEAAARRSTTVVDPTEPPRVVRRSDTPVPFGMVAELRVAGTGEVLVFPVHSATSTGLSLVVAADREVALAAGAAVMVHLRGENGRAPIDVKMRAEVSHVRPPRAGTDGGLSMRWVDADGPVARHIERALQG